MKIHRCLTCLGVVFAMGCSSALAEPTEITVRVLSKGAKFIGTAVGGAEISLRDADTGEVLAQGMTMGGTGNTPKIMTTPRTSRDTISDPDAASFSTTIDLDSPRKISVTAMGPMEPGGAAVSASSTQWVVPGKHINGGDAWVLELRGFSVSLVEPPPSNIDLTAAHHRVALTAKVTMLCGCPIESGGMWDADKLEVAAIVHKSGASAKSVPLSFSGEVNIFAGEIEITEPGEYTVDAPSKFPA
jgi:hypothetical protein